MRRIIRHRVAASIEQGKPQLNDYIARSLQFPEAFPYLIHDPVASIREVRKLQITPRFEANYPPVEVLVTVWVSLAARTRQRDGGIGPRVFDVDVELAARGQVRGDGTYRIVPQSATVKAWWSGLGSTSGRPS